MPTSPLPPLPQKYPWCVSSLWLSCLGQWCGQSPNHPDHGLGLCQTPPSPSFILCSCHFTVLLMFCENGTQASSSFPPPLSLDSVHHSTSGLQSYCQATSLGTRLPVLQALGGCWYHRQSQESPKRKTHYGSFSRKGGSGEEAREVYARMSLLLDMSVWLLAFTQMESQVVGWRFGIGSGAGAGKTHFLKNYYQPTATWS